MTLPEPELADGAVDAGERLLPVLEPPVLELPDVPEAELPDVPEAELPDVPVLPAVAVEPELPEVACCAPGSANATAPAAAMLTALAVAVTARSLACPRSRSATARLVACGCLLIGWFLLARFGTQPRRQGWATPLARL